MDYSVTLVFYLSIVMTSCSTLLALGMMPLLLYLYCQGFSNLHTAVPYAEIILSLVMVLVPCGIGILINTYRPRYSKIVTKVCAYLPVKETEGQTDHLNRLAVFGR